MNATDLALMRLMDRLEHPDESLLLVWDHKGAAAGPQRWGASAHCRLGDNMAGVVAGYGRSIAQALDDLRLAVERSR